MLKKDFGKDDREIPKHCIKRDSVQLPKHKK